MKINMNKNKNVGVEFINGELLGNLAGGGEDLAGSQEQKFPWMIDKPVVEAAKQWAMAGARD